MASQHNTHVEETRVSLERIQTFDASTIGRREELGAELNFEPGVEPLRRTIALFREISPDVLADMSTQRRNSVKQLADSLFNMIDQINKFSAASGNPKPTRDSYIQQLVDGYDNYFEQLWPAIAYSVRRATDFARMEQEARASIQSIKDRTSQIEAELKVRQAEADAALDAIRKVAAEQGVSQQAIFFRDEATKHESDAKRWLGLTRKAIVALLFFAGLTLFLHKVPGLRPVSAAEAIQFGIGKMLVFGTLAYTLLLSARNFSAHTHNAVVNKHRQNSLVTYKALVEAAGDQGNRDIILAKAAESIFSAQSTGFSKHEGEESKAMSMVSVGAGALRGAGGE